MSFSKDNNVVVVLRVEIEHIEGYQNNYIGDSTDPTHIENLILTFYVENMLFGTFKCLLGILSNNVLSLIMVTTLIMINHSSKLFSKDMQKKRIIKFLFQKLDWQS